MRESVKDLGRLEHILMAINNVFEFLEGKSYEDFAMFSYTTITISILGLPG